MSARTGFLAGLSAAVAAAVTALWVTRDSGEDSPDPTVGAAGASAEAARPGASSPETSPDDGPAPVRLDVLAPPAEGAADAAEESALDAAREGPGDAGLGGAPSAPSNTEQFAQEIAANLGWPSLGPYEANQLGAEAAQFAQARTAALEADQAGADPMGQWATLTRSAEELAGAWIERFGRARAAQLIEYLGVTGFDPATGAARPLDLESLARTRRQR